MKNIIHFFHHPFLRHELVYWHIEIQTNSIAYIAIVNEFFYSLSFVGVFGHIYYVPK